MSGVSARASALGRSPTVALLDEVTRRRARGEVVLNLSGGEPDFDTPVHISEAGRAALASGFTHYTPSRGLPELRAAIVRKLADDNGVLVASPDDIVVTVSAKHAMFLAMATVLDSDDEVLLPTPSWVSYQPMAAILGARAVPVPLRAAEDFTITAAGLRAVAGDRTKAIVINTPNNPTGRMLTPEEADAVATIANEQGLIILTDEIYEHIRYDGRPHISLGSRDDCRERTLTVNGFSKSYAMTGWRLGYVAGPGALIQHLVKVQEHTVGCASSFAQRGALAALNGPASSIAEMTAEYARRRDRVVRGLNSIEGVACPAPDGAFYAFPDVGGLGISGDDFCRQILQVAGVVLTPGSAFGPTTSGHVRMSFATEPEVLEDAVKRIATAAPNLLADGIR